MYTRLDPKVCWSGMRIVRFIHIAYEVLRDLAACGTCMALYVRVLYRTV